MCLLIEVLSGKRPFLSQQLNRWLPLALKIGWIPNETSKLTAYNRLVSMPI